MIIFVFEGGKSEPVIFDSLKHIFLTGEQVCTVKCRHDLPTLYSKLKRSEYDLFRSLPLEESGVVIPEGARIDTLFSQIFLFFDYDFQNRMGLQALNEILEEMLEYFDDETENGKLYINYPMVESLKYTKEMIDGNYCLYTTSRALCQDHKFKSSAESFAYPQARGYRFIDLNKTPAREVEHNWHNLLVQNVSKANYIVSGNNAMPARKEDVGQRLIFEAQVNKYVMANSEVAILNSFPIFLYEYFKM